MDYKCGERSDKMPVDEDMMASRSSFTLQDPVSKVSLSTIRKPRQEKLSLSVKHLPRRKGQHPPKFAVTDSRAKPRCGYRAINPEQTGRTLVWLTPDACTVPEEYHAQQDQTVPDHQKRPWDASEDLH